MRFSALIITFIILLLGASSTFFVYLNISKLKSDISAIEAMRYRVIAGGVSDAAEQGLRFGLLVDQLDNMNLLLQRLREQYHEVQAAVMIGENCDSLFGDHGDLPPAKTLCALKGRSGVIELNGSRLVFKDIINSFDRSVGSIVLMYPSNLQVATIAAATLELVRTTVQIEGVALAICIAGAFWLTRSTSRGYAALASALETGNVSGLAPTSDLHAQLAVRKERIAGVETDLVLAETAARGA